MTRPAACWAWAARSSGNHSPRTLPPGRLRDVLTGAVTGVDRVVLTKESVLVVNHRAVVIAGRPAGSVITVQDRTEMEELIRELDSATGLAHALRAQEHEFANRLHVIGGLLDLQEVDEARTYLDTVAAVHTGSAEDLRARISPPVIAALLLAKQSIAAERDVDRHSHAGFPPGPADRGGRADRDDHPGQPDRQRTGRRRRSASTPTSKRHHYRRVQHFDRGHRQRARCAGRNT